VTYFKTTELSKIAVLSALYVVCSFIPISIFLGAQSFLSLAIVIVPIMSVLLRSREAFVSSIIGGLILLIVNPGANMFGFLTILLPLIGVTAGSLLYNNKKGAIAPIGVCLISVLYYLTQRSEFPFWIIPHIVAIVMTGTFFFNNKFKSNFFAISFITTMCEQSVMLILAVSFLGLPVIVFQAAFVLMLYERAFASLGGGVVLFFIKKSMPNLIIRGENK
jgi:uncharacterized membrane protein